jgi:hypothetical protein
MTSDKEEKYKCFHEEYLKGTKETYEKIKILEITN